MQFKVVATFVGLAATLISANPTPAPGLAELLATRDITTNATLTLDAADCEPLKCVDIIAAAGCIVVAAATDNPASLLSCVAGNTDKICNCAGCISSVGNFLDTHGIC